MSAFDPLWTFDRTGSLHVMTKKSDEATALALMPEAQKWNESSGSAPEDWISCVGSCELAIGYSLIFWPPLVAFDRYVLREGCFSEEGVRDWERATNNDRAAIEGVINHVHLLDIHRNSPVEPTEAQLRYLGRMLRETHAAKLQQDFPDRSFEVVFNDEPGLDLIDYEVTFWQID